MKKCNFGRLEKICDVHKRGSSSFKMHDIEKIFSEFDLKEGECMADLGCGPGDYVFEASKRIGDDGLIFAIDKERELIEDINEKIDKNGLVNIVPIAADIRDRLPLNSGAADICIAVTVLHIPGISIMRENLFNEIYRVLKNNGRFFTIDVKKGDDSFGPPVQMRLSPEDIEEIALKHGFKKIKFLDLEYTYMMQFIKGE